MFRAAAATDVVGQLVMADDQFSRWVRLLEKRTGIVLPSTRKDFLVSNLRSRMREIGQVSFDTYYDLLQAGDRAKGEWVYLVDRLTVHQTHFFRHPPSFAAMKEWAETRIRNEVPGPITAWSVGCSTGEEAYSIAMQIDAVAQSMAYRLQYGVSATDVSQLSLITARKAVYANNKLKEVPLEFQSAYIKAVGSDQFEVIEGIRRRVGFSPFNMMDLSRGGLKPFDLIYCQNVMIYFSRARRIEILDAFSRLLNPGGLLLIGPGEVTSYENASLRRISNKNVLGFFNPEGRNDIG